MFYAIEGLFVIYDYVGLNATLDVDGDQVFLLLLTLIKNVYKWQSKFMEI